MKLIQSFIRSCVPVYSRRRMVEAQVEIQDLREINQHLLKERELNKLALPEVAHNTQAFVDGVRHYAAMDHETREIHLDNILRHASNRRYIQ